MTTVSEQLDQLSPLQRAVLALKTVRAQLDALKHKQSEPIAIIGMGCRLPRNADTPEAFWQLLHSGADCIGPVPADRWDVAAFYDPDPAVAGKMYTQEGGFLQTVDAFDPQFFGIAPREAVKMDPQQRLLLEVSWEALERAGLSPAGLSGTRTGVYVGINSNDYAHLPTRSKDVADLDAFTFTGSTFSVAAGRLSFVLGLQGPCMAVDTSCSSALVAVHLACQALRAGECELALAGGVNLILSPTGHIVMSRMRAMAMDGRCKTFDAAADGYGRGEGCGVVVLKRLSDAQRDGDPILALIRGSAVNQDGPSSGLTVPNGPAQQAVIRQALASAGLEPRQVGYVEAHGTGTPLGDPIEIQALNTVFGKDRPPDQPLIVGSVKTNIGHLEAAAGIAGIIKLVLTLQHKSIPPHLHLHTPNPYIPWDQLAITVPLGSTPWPDSAEPRIAGISSFGMSGTNAHMLLQEPPAPEPAALAQPERPLHLLCLSARSEPALRELAASYARHLAEHPAIPFADVCFTANAGRAHFAHRLALVAATGEAARAHLADFAAGRPSAVVSAQVRGKSRPRVAFLCTGQGAQYAGMGQQLYATQPTFRAALDRCAEILLPILGADIRPIMFGTDDQASNGADRTTGAGDAELLNSTQYTQPALFAIEYALAELWRSWGVEPEALLGHSVGEYVAACLAGVFSLEDGLKLIAARGRLMQALPAGGAMAAIFADAERVAAAIEPHRPALDIAAVNGPSETVVSGQHAAVEALLAAFEAQGVKGRRLVVSHAFHSALMEPMLDEFERVAAGLTYHPPRIDLISNLTGRVAEPDALGTPGYWRRHVRMPVRFADGIQTLHEQGYPLVLEIGPKATLSTMAQKCPRAEESVWLASLQKGRDDWQQLLASLGALYLGGITLDWAGFERDTPRRRQILPTYPFQRARYWVEQAVERPAAFGQSAAGHPLLGQRLRAPVPLFETQLWAGAAAFLGGYHVAGLAVAPAAVFAEMALAAAAEVYGEGRALLQLALLRALALPEQQTQTVQILLSPAGADQAALQIFGLPPGAGQDDWQVLASATLALTPQPAPAERLALDELRQRCAERVSGEAFYAQLDQQGLAYAPDMQALAALERGPGEALGLIQLSDAALQEHARYRLHPALLDAAGLVLQAAAGTEPADGPRAVASVERLALYARPAGRIWSYATLRDRTPDALVGDVRLADESGQILAELHGLRFERFDQGLLQHAARERLAPLLYQVAWQPTPRAPAPAEQPAGEPGGWLILADTHGLGAALARELEARGEHCVLLAPGAQFSPAEPGRYLVDPLSPADFRRVFAQARSADGPAWRGVVHLWGIDIAPADSAEALAASQRLGSASLLCLAQALAAEGGPRPPRLWAVTRGAQSAGAETPRVEQAGLWGLGRGLTLELPQSWGGLIDLAPDAGPADVPALLAELWQPDDEDQIILRGAERSVARLVRSAPPPAQPLRIQPAGTYILAGDSAPLLLSLAGWLAEQGATRLVLAGGHDLDPHSPALDDLRQRGLSLHLARVSADAPAAQQAAIQTICAAEPDLRGFIHTTGPWDVTLLQDMTIADLDRVFRREGLSAWAWQRALAQHDLDFFVLCSSVASVWGSGGLAHYASAHRLLDALALERRASGRPALAINWGQWAEMGMLSEDGYRMSARSGVTALPPAQALEALAALAGSDLAQQTVAAVDWSVFKPVSEIARRRPLLSLIEVAAPAQSDGPPVKTDIVLQLEDALAADRADMLTGYVQQIVADVLGFPAGSLPEPQQGFFDMGMDSIMAVELNNRLSSGLGVQLPPTLTFDYPSIEAIIGYLLSQVLVFERPEEAPAGPSEADLRAEAEARLSQLSEDELVALLAAELTLPTQ